MFAKKFVILAFALVALSAEAAADEEEDAAVAETAEAIVEGEVATEADAEMVDCSGDEVAACIDAWVSGGCMPEAPEGCDQYEGCAMEALAAGDCGADCMDETATSCEAEWLEKGCSQDSAVLGEEFITKCDAYKACGMLTMTQGRCPEGAAMEEACAAEEQACMDNEECKTQFDDSMSACLGDSEDSAQFAACMTDAMNADNFAPELQETVTAWSGCVAAMEAEMEALCAEEAAAGCVGAWVDAGCPADFEPTEDCMQYEACALGAMDEGACPAEEGGEEAAAEEPAAEEEAAAEEPAEEVAEEAETEAAAQEGEDDMGGDEDMAAEEEGADGEGAEASAGLAATAFAALFALAL